ISSTAGTMAEGAKGVALLHDPDDAVATAAPAQWALGYLREALTARGVTARLCRQLNEVAADEVCIVAGGSAARWPRELLERARVQVPAGPEALALLGGNVGGRAAVLASGNDARGLSYALLDLADRVAHAAQPIAGLEVRQPVVERPAN